jgi:hypothetical protein
MTMKPGATGKFPLGPMTPSDEGELVIAISIYGGNVKIDFGKPVAWLGFPPAMAIEFANKIIKKAEEAKKQFS